MEPSSLRGKRDRKPEFSDPFRYQGWVTDIWGDIYHVSVSRSECKEGESFASQMKDEWIDCKIDRFYLLSLVELLHELGLIPSKITPESRSEDLKIIHRLLDKLPSINSQEQVVKE